MLWCTSRTHSSWRHFWMLRKIEGKYSWAQGRNSQWDCCGEPALSLFFLTSRLCLYLLVPLPLFLRSTIVSGNLILVLRCVGKIMENDLSVRIRYWSQQSNHIWQLVGNVLTFSFGTNPLYLILNCRYVKERSAIVWEYLHEEYNFCIGYSNSCYNK